MRVYLDNCCYNRPFDDQGQLKVLLETLAKLDKAVAAGKWYNEKHKEDKLNE